MEKQVEALWNVLSKIHLSDKSLLTANNEAIKQLKFYWPEIQAHAKEHLSGMQHGANIGRVSDLMMFVDEIKIENIIKNFKKLDKGQLSGEDSKLLFYRYCVVLNLFLLFSEKEEIKLGQSVRQFAALLNKAKSFEELNLILKEDRKQRSSFFYGVSARLRENPAVKGLLYKLPGDTRSFSMNLLNTINKLGYEGSFDPSSVANFLSKLTLQSNLSSAHLLLFGFVIITVGFLVSVLRGIKDFKLDLFDLTGGATFMVALGCLFAAASVSAPVTLSA